MDLFKTLTQKLNKAFTTPIITKPTSITGTGAVGPLAPKPNMTLASSVKPVVPTATPVKTPNMSYATQPGQNMSYATPQIKPIVAPKTSTGKDINIKTGGTSTPPPTVTPPPVIKPTSVVTPPLPIITQPEVTTPTPINPFETRVADAEKSYMEAGQMTPEEIKAQEDLDKLTESFRQGYQGTEEQTIPMEFITGQQQSLEKRALNLAEPLTDKLARLEAKRTASLGASKFALERADKALEASKAPATEGFTLGENQTRYDAFGNVIAGGGKSTPSTYVQGADPIVDGYAANILSGMTKLENVPEEYRGQVSQAISGQTVTPEVSAYQAERTTRIRNSVDDLLKRVGSKTVGFGSLLSVLPESDARNFQADLDSLVANITYGELTAMREASKTGGALGQVSDKEGQLLGAALGALDTKQSPENFKKNLNQIKESLTRWEEANKKYGGTTGASSGSSIFAEEW
jgi:hypothetical protein